MLANTLPANSISRQQVFILKHHWENLHKADIKAQILMFELYNFDFFFCINLNINTAFTLHFTQVTKEN